MNDIYAIKDLPEDDEDGGSSPLGWLRFRKKTKNDTGNNVRDVIEDLLEDEEDAERNKNNPVSHLDKQERTLIANVLRLSKLCAVDVMIPRADIVALDADAKHNEVLVLLGKTPYNRIPVYRETLDDIIGFITVKDILKCLSENREIKITEILREVLIVSPAVPVLDLMLEMRNSKKHMALVIDEYGGIDGLVTIGDLTETVIGEMNDEHDRDNTDEIISNPDGTVTVDARFDIEEFEEKFGKILNDDEREEIDTLGGLAMAVAARLPTRGEILHHESSGLEIEVIDADPRRVKRLCIRIPSSSKQEKE